MTGVEVAVAFGRALRRDGLAAPTGSVTTFAASLDAVGLERRDRVRAAARACLLRGPEERDRFDRCFASFFDGTPLNVPGPGPSVTPVPVVTDDGTPDAPLPPEGHAVEAARLRFSASEVLRTKDLATCTPSEMDELHRALRTLRLTGPERRSRRTRPHHRGRLDVRRTVRAALTTAGEPIDLARRDRSTRRRRVVLLLDVSGSMEPYARAFLRFAHASVVAGDRVEVFALGTRLTRLTRHLATHDPDLALAAAGAAIPDWAGGTRLGDGLRAFNDRWGVRGLARGAVVVVLSDGWDRGEPERLGAEVARLHRVTARLVWANPLKASPGYAPLAAGMAAALPHVDAFVECHALASLESLAATIASAVGS